MAILCLPFARRRDKVLLPCLVRIRTKNPCLRFLTIFVGVLRLNFIFQLLVAKFYGLSRAQLRRYNLI